MSSGGSSRGSHQPRRDFVGVLLAAAVVVLVALPFLREPVAADDRLDAPNDAEERRLALVEERDRALAALKELEFDHRTGKVDDADYARAGRPAQAGGGGRASCARFAAGVADPNVKLSV